MPRLLARPIIPIALLVTSILLGYYLSAGHYQWDFPYIAEPLTATSSIKIRTTGATIGINTICEEDPDVFAHIVKAGSFKMLLEIDPNEVSKLKNAFSKLVIYVELYKDGVLVNSKEFIILADGSVFTPLQESFSLLVGDYDVVIKADFETKPIIETIDGTFIIEIYFIPAG